jgi:hypothetical protein
VKPILIAIFLVFAAYTLYAMSEVGLSGIYLAGSPTPAASRCCSTS